MIYVHTQKGEGATLDFLNTDLCQNAGISSERSFQEKETEVDL